MVSVILLIVRLTGEAILWEKANVKEAVAVLDREDRMYKIHAVLQGKWSSVLVNWLTTEAIGLKWTVPEAL